MDSVRLPFGWPPAEADEPARPRIWFPNELSDGAEDER